jgi:hypothetical protein
VGLQKEPGTPGQLRCHLLATGLEFIYEGVTIATMSGRTRSSVSSPSP